MCILGTDLIKLHFKIVGNLLWNIDFDGYSDYTFPYDIKICMAKSNVVP